MRAARRSRWSPSWPGFNPHPSPWTGASARCPASGGSRWFQSSPVAVDGCERAPRGDGLRGGVSILTRRRGRVRAQPVRRVRAPRQRISILTRRRGRVRADDEVRGSREEHVSILTRRRGRVRGRRAARSRLRPTGFNPHPSPWTGARAESGALTSPADGFQSSHVAVDGCERTRRGRTCSRPRFNPHPSPWTGASWCASSRAARERISILTRRRGRVRGHRPLLLVVEAVSILTRRRGRVRARASATSASDREFQSSPVAVDGCELERQNAILRASQFQSSPVAVDGCEPGPRLRRGPPGGFNPHPSPWTGARCRPRSGAPGTAGFNPHPSPWTGASLSTRSRHTRNGSFNPHPSPWTGARPLVVHQETVALF